MPALEKAKLQEITNGDDPKPVGAAVNVQFNPESLKIQLSNRIEGGRTQGRQVRQYVGSSSNIFTLELEFDTADEGTTDEPVSVLERTEIVEKYIQPKTDGNNAKQQPAMLRFQWGNLIIDGVVESIDLDFDHFAHNGYPLHAKATLKMKEQKIKFQLTERGSAGGDGVNDRAARALGGELPAEFASRLGLNPGAWRGLGLDLSLGLGLDAGLEIGFSAGLSALAGLGFKAGVEAGIDVSLEASVGLEVGAEVSGVAHLQNSASIQGDVSSQVALARAGGVTEAITVVKSAKADSASGAALSAFPGVATATAVDTPTTPSGAASSRGTVNGGTRTSPGRKAKAKFVVDPRASGFGYGVPLKPQRTPAIIDSRDYSFNPKRSSTVNAASGVAVRSATPWLSLPAKDGGRDYADIVQRKRQPRKRCGCLGRCSH